MEDDSEIDSCFEREMPSAATRPLFETAKSLGRECRQISQGASAGPCRQTAALPEKRYFEPGDLGFPVWRAFGANVGMCICKQRSILWLMAVKSIERKSVCTTCRQREAS
jgi:N-carbamoyl-D-amino-acid hydrolase